jgi:phospholipid/cholesterol/gamma-HCH transport system substrate-binding protein
MRERELAIKFRVGLFISVLLLLFAAFVLAIGTQSRLFEERYTLKAAFRDIQGLIVGSPVRLAGLTVGTVSHISFSADPADPRVHVEVSIDRRFQPRIREDSVATIGTIGLVGDKIFEVTVGSEQARILSPGERVQSVEPVEFAQTIASLTEGLGALKGILEEVEKGPGLLHALIYDEAGGEFVRDLAPLVQTLNRNAARLEEILKTVQEGDGLLHALVFDEEGKVLLEELKGTGSILQDLRSAASDLKTISRDLAEGRGTLGALLQDPTIYEDLSSLLRGAERSWILRGLIRSSVRGGRDTPKEGGK